MRRCAVWKISVISFSISGMVQICSTCNKKNHHLSEGGTVSNVEERYPSPTKMTPSVINEVVRFKVITLISQNQLKYLKQSLPASFSLMNLPLLLPDRCGTRRTSEEIQDQIHRLTLKDQLKTVMFFRKFPAPLSLHTKSVAQSPHFSLDVTFVRITSPPNRWSGCRPVPST